MSSYEKAIQIAFHTHGWAEQRIRHDARREMRDVQKTSDEETKSLKWAFGCGQQPLQAFRGSD